MKLFRRQDRLSDKLTRTSRRIGKILEEWEDDASENDDKKEMRKMQKYFERDVPDFIKDVKREFEDYVDSDKSLRIMFGRDRFRDKVRRARRRVGKFCSRILPEKSKQATTHTPSPVAESTTPSPEPNAPEPERQDEPGSFSHAFFAILAVSLLWSFSPVLCILAILCFLLIYVWICSS